MGSATAIRRPRKLRSCRRLHDPDADVDYLFLQVFVGQPLVSAAKPCSKILAALGPAAIERSLVTVPDEMTDIRIHLLNTGEIATARNTPGGCDTA